MARDLNSPQDSESRAARILRPAASPADASTERMASFRPAEEVAVRRDVLEAFARAMGDDVRMVQDHEPTRRARSLAELLVEEALEHPDRINTRQVRHVRAFGADVDYWQLVRRVLDAHGECSRDAIESLAALNDEETRKLAGLEVLHRSWKAGDNAQQLLQQLDALMGEDTLDDQSVLSALIATLLGIDLLLELGQVDQAVTALDGLRHHPGLDSQQRGAIAGLQASWEASRGRLARAVEILESATGHCLIDEDLEDLLLSLHQDLDNPDDAFEVLSQSTLSRKNAPDALALAGYTLYRDSSMALEVFERAGRDFPEDRLIREAHIATTHSVDPQRPELIDLLNVRLRDESISKSERVWTLCELGRLFETRAQAGEPMESAAAEVYVEALALEPNYTPAVRALGRLYSRLGEWQLLCDLYEKEIALLGNAPFVWRRHFQVAEIYENKVGDLSRAMHHFLSVVRKRQGYLPALKGAARLMEQKGQWRELADLFLGSVASANSSRQKLYLLDKVAEIAESQLGNMEVAIGAWEEILHLDPAHPRAFSALGRLYARTERWMDLVRINERELGSIEDSEEAAAMLVRNAEIAADRLEQFDLAEDAYRRALALLPDYLPALEGLGRIYVKGARWDELVAMTERQLCGTTDERETLRHLGALAELMEFEQGHEADAVLLYGRMLDINPNQPHVFHALARLHRQTGNWRALLELLEARLESLPADEHSEILSEVAFTLEWRLESSSEAFHVYLRGAQVDSGELHWLRGIMRTWKVACADALQLAKTLEELAIRPMDGSSRDAYFLSIARLKERTTGNPEKSIGYRVHGDESNRENQAILRLNNAFTGDRGALSRLRSKAPLFDFEQVLGVSDWSANAKLALDRLMIQADQSERRYFVGWLPNHLASEWIEDEDDAPNLLRREFQRILSGAPADTDSTSLEVMRLLAEEALVAGDKERWLKLAQTEVAQSPSRELRVRRLVDIATAVGSKSALESAWNEAFSEDPTLEDGPVVEFLFTALRNEQMWDGLKAGLEAHVKRVELSDKRRADLFDELGRVLEEKVLDLDGAKRAFEHAWQLTHAVGYLLDVVRVCKSLGDLHAAAEFQSLHFEIALKSEHPEERLRSGIDLAELCVNIGDPSGAIKHLEMLLHPKASLPLYEQVKVRLAHLHCDFGDVERGIRLFEETLSFNAQTDELQSWRRLVRAYKIDLGDIAAAYALQWKLVRSIPNSLDDIDELLEIAWEINELPDCCKELESFAKDLPAASKISLMGRAAVALDEDLGRSDEAARLYRELVALGGPESTLDYRRRLAFSLSRTVGREVEALKHFETLIQEEPYESTSYKGMADLFEKVQAYDRARVARQFMRTLNMKVEGEEIRAKSSVSRAFADEDIRNLLLPEELKDVFSALHAVLPIAEKIWAADLPQRKAIEGEKIKDARFLDFLNNANQMFGIKKVRAVSDDSAPLTPFVFHESTPMVCFNSELLETASEGEQKFFAGYAAAISWSEMSGLLTLDGRQVWHLLEGVLFKQTGRGFTDRVDAESQRLAEEVSSPFHTVARRRVVQALEPALEGLAESHCEAWPLLLHRFATRVALLSCSDVESATRALLRLEGWTESLDEEATQRQLRRSKSVEDLFRFAMSEAFLEARFRVGLGSRPTQFTRA